MSAPEPPAARRPIEVLHAERDALAQRLALVTDHAGREQLKADIIALYREIDQVVRAVTELRDATRALAEQWKASAPSVPNPPATPERAHAPLRVDHLGASTYIEKGWSRISIGDPVEAEIALRRAGELAPQGNEAESLLAWALALQERHDEAERVVVGVLARDANHPLALAVAGFVALGHARHDDAIDLLHRGIAHAGADRRALLYAHLHLGMVYFARAMHADAEQYLRRAIELGPNLVQASYELGRTLWFAGRTDDAIATWRRASAENKFSPWARRCAEMLELIERGGEPAPLR